MKSVSNRTSIGSAYLALNTNCDLAVLPLICRHWQRFIGIHTNPIYHKAALLHGYVQSTAVSLEDASRSYSSRSVGSVTGWKDLCRKRYLIEKSWSGNAPSRVTPHHGSGKFVHRIKVDEKAGYILTTSSVGGLKVIDMQDDRELWSLPDSHVRPYAHCEYGEGFIIFDYIDGSKEVWRRVDDFSVEEAASVVPESLPRPRQKRVFAAALEKYRAAAETSTRGHFRPWAVLHPPQTTRAFRFSYPTLGAAAWDTVYLWDVRTGTLVQTIDQTQLGSNGEGEEDPALEFLGDINYIEVSEKYVFLCGIHSLRAFSRETGKSVLDIPSSRHPLAAWRYTISPNRPSAKAPGASLIPQHIEARSVPRAESNIVDEFIAVHISSCGSHLVALLLSSRLLIIPFFERAFQDGAGTYEIALEVQLGSPCHSSRYLAFEDGRIGACTKTGLFVVQPDWSEHSQQDADAAPCLSVFRVPALGDRSCLGAVSCLQMTDTGLFLNWDTQCLPEPHEVEQYDDAFYASVVDETRFASLANGIEVTLVDLEQPEFDPESSTVVSVDFFPT
ncbi:hypothetical protein LshimejAT787_0311670 [Lyophyllum shimeji]|uniref:Uncharacterized protein n=1 Tax=Lyophyllum shimeji TaxID=47721 RepID=A0A9P3UMK7_LYOSH|nr:hypothetical protein LshimejAT787_0311670 [Lyophyllum shimeji]